MARRKIPATPPQATEPTPLMSGPVDMPAITDTSGKPRIRVRAGSSIQSAEVANLLPSASGGNGQWLPAYPGAAGSSLPMTSAIGPVETSRYNQRLLIWTRWLYRNDGWIRKAIDTVAEIVIGTGPVIRTDFPELNEILDAHAEEWDTRNVFSRGQLIKQAYTADRVDGESLLRLRPRDLSDGLTIPLQFQLLEADHLDWSECRALEGGNRTEAGVEFDALDRPVALHLWRVHPGDSLARSVQRDSNMTTVRVPASAVCHLFNPPRISAPRGETRLLPLIEHAINRGKFEASTLTRMAIAAQQVGFIKRPPEDAGALPGEEEDELSAFEIFKEAMTKIRMTPGTLNEVPHGTDFQWSAPPEPGTGYKDYMRLSLMYLAACCGIDYQTLASDWEGANDRTWRAAQVAIRRFADGERERVRRQVLVPIHKQIVDLAIATGAWIPPEGISRHRLYKFRCSWPSAKNPNQFQEFSAYKAAIDAGLIDRDTAIEELGGDPQERDIRQAESEARARSLKLAFMERDPAVATPLADRIQALIEAAVSEAIRRREESDGDEGALT